MSDQFKCKQCGWCCKNLPIPITYSDIMKWVGSPNILQEISFIDNYPKKGTGAFYIAKTTFNPKQPCPFLDSHMNCSIHRIKPKTCEDFPYGAKHYPNCILSCSLKSNINQANTIKTSQHSDFKRAYLQKERLLKILVMTRY